MSGSGGTVLVTGGGSGIGRATCALLDERGWKAVPADIDPPSNGVALDVRDETGWARVMEGITDLAGLVNCAGVRSHTTLEDMELDAWRRVVDTNLTGTFLGTRAAFRAFRSQGTGGAVVNVGSIASFVATPHQAHYVATKGGILQFTKSAALEGGPNGIRVNAVAPGPTMTPLIADGLADPERRATVDARVPLGRIAEPDDIAEVILFLLSDASRYVTGVTIPVDGGWLTSS